MIKLMSKDPKWSEEEQDYMLWVLNGPALAVRERLINNQRLSRILSALGVMNEGFAKGQQKLLKVIEPLYEAPLFKKLSILGAGKK